MSKFPPGIWLFSRLPCLRNGVCMSVAAQPETGLVALSTLPRSYSHVPALPCHLFPSVATVTSLVITILLLSFNSPALFWVSLPTQQPASSLLLQDFARGSYCSQNKIPKSKPCPVQTWWDASPPFPAWFPHQLLPTAPGLLPISVFPQPELLWP